MLNISKEGIEKAMNSRNKVLAAMGFDSDEAIIEVEEKAIETKQAFSKYGEVIETEIAYNVFEVSYEKQDLYIQDFNKQNKGYFVGE